MKLILSILPLLRHLFGFLPSFRVATVFYFVHVVRFPLDGLRSFFSSFCILSLVHISFLGPFSGFLPSVLVGGIPPPFARSPQYFTRVIHLFRCSQLISCPFMLFVQIFPLVNRLRLLTIVPIRMCGVFAAIL